MYKFIEKKYKNNELLRRSLGLNLAFNTVYKKHYDVFS